MAKSSSLAFAMMIAIQVASSHASVATATTSVVTKDIPQGTWSKTADKTWCENRIVIGTGTFAECQSQVVADSACSKVTYSNPKNDKCFCVPAGAKCEEASADWTDVYEFTAAPKDIPQGTWSKTADKTWCKNRIVIGTGTFAECQSQVVADSACSKVTYSNPKNDKCFCVPAGAKCEEDSADWTDVYEFTAAPEESSEESSEESKDGCDGQNHFNVRMCKSFMCTRCTLDWCTRACQETQRDYPTCRCASWPEARKSYSSGDFEGRGQFGDAGDYASAAAAFLSTEIKTEA